MLDPAGPELIESVLPPALSAGPDFQRERGDLLRVSALCPLTLHSLHRTFKIQVAQLLFMLGQTPRDALHGADEPKKRKARQDSIQAAPTPRPVGMGDDKKVMVLPTLFLLLRLALPCLLACYL
jgi:hypothetical protein